MKVETIKYKDVREKVQLYLKITNTKDEIHLINIGLKTYDEINKLIENEKPIANGKPDKMENKR